MANLNELEGIGNDAGFDVNYDDVPEQLGGFAPTPPPGSYRFRLPGDLANIWEQFDVTIDDKPQKRLRAQFEESSVLTITSSVSGDQDGNAFRTRITNVERKRGKSDAKASDMLYLLRALGDEQHYASNKAYAEALMKFAGKEFVADVEWAAWCNSNKPIRSQDEDGNTVIVESQNGCGERVYQRDIPKVDGAYAETFGCPGCGALLRAFPNLARFRAIPTEA